ncbi:dihydroorotase [Zymobacter sp. IVIA_12111.31 C1]|uniref:dihydroorotase n=1 Tax=Zymobacter sp. IVIA_12111.31 C1 TaxID=3394854 RepID=UPI0039C38BE6
MTIRTMTLRRPDDWHLHVRDADMLKAVVPWSSAHFGRAIIMPNLVPPITSVEAALAYRDRILAAIPPKDTFVPLMTCYLTEGLDPRVLREGFLSGLFAAAKLYPAHATTNSAFGVSHWHAITDLLETMQEIDMPLLIHGEVTDADIDIFDREAAFIDRVLQPLRKAYPALRIVMEHITTREAADYVREAGPHTAATLTPQHLLIDRNAMLVGGIRPHLFCLPILKRREHTEALRALATSGFERVFLGTDSAPHARTAKESACGCAGIFNAPTALSTYAEIFEDEGALDHLEAFCSENGPRFYGLPLNEERITLQRNDHTVPERITDNGQDLHPFRAGETLRWHVVTA